MILSDTESPCVRNCCLDNNDICLGCFRTMAEIMQWVSTETSMEQKQQILSNAKQRRQAQLSNS